MRNVLSGTTLGMVVLAVMAVWISAAADGPPRGVASGVTTPFSGLWHGVVERVGPAASALIGRGPQKRIRELEEEVRRLQAAASEVADLRQQNLDLRSYYGLPKRSGWRPILAEVIARDPVTWNRGFRISRGANDGVSPGAVVLAGEYVIGRVGAVQPGSATVLTLAARGCRLSVRLQESGATGVLEGLGTAEWRQPPICRVDFLPKETEASPGEYVWTSGLGDAVPVGLVVGKVAAIDGGAEAHKEVVQGAHARITVEPLAPFDRNRFVAVYCAENGQR